MNINTGEKSNSESQNFETLNYNIADNTPDILLDDSCDPDVNFHNFDTHYLFPEKFMISWTIPHLTTSLFYIRSIKKKKKKKIEHLK